MHPFDFCVLTGVLNPSTLWCNKTFDRERSSRVLIPLRVLYRLTFKSKTASGFALFLIHEILRNAWKFLTGVGFEPTHTFVYQKSRARSFLESGALDRSAILPCNLYCTLLFGLLAVVLPFWMVQIRNLFWHIVSNFWNFLVEVFNWSSPTNFVNAKKCISRDASIWFLRSYRGFEPKHPLV